MSQRPNKLTLLVTIFPLIIGLALTVVGIIDLNTASEPPEPEPNHAYGVLAFSSYHAEEMSGGIILQEIDLKKDVINIKIDTNLKLVPPDDKKPYEVAFGFQLPGVSDQPQFYLTGIDKEAGLTTTEFNVLEEKVVTYKSQDCSLIYVRFIAQPNYQYYRIVAVSNIKGLVTKQSFSTYDVSVPISTTESYLLSHSGLTVSSIKVNWACMMYAPPGTELKWAIPYPDSQESWLPFTDSGEPTSVSYNSFTWKNRDVGFDQNSNDVRSDIIRVLLEFGSEKQVQDRLFFDSGLYMGIGIGLVISGLNELLRILARLRGPQAHVNN